MLLSFPNETLKSLYEEQREIRGIKQTANFYSSQLRCKNTRINLMYMVGGEYDNFMYMVGGEYDNLMYMVGGEYDNLPPSTSLNR